MTLSHGDYFLKEKNELEGGERKEIVKSMRSFAWQKNF